MRNLIFKEIKEKGFKNINKANIKKFQAKPYALAILSNARKWLPMFAIVQNIQETLRNPFGCRSIILETCRCIRKPTGGSSGTNEQKRMIFCGRDFVTLKKQ